VAGRITDGVTGSPQETCSDYMAEGVPVAREDFAL
jgi:hypothetical protein